MAYPERLAASTCSGQLVLVWMGPFQGNQAAGSKWHVRARWPPDEAHVVRSPAVRFRADYKGGIKDREIKGGNPGLHLTSRGKTVALSRVHLLLVMMFG